MANSLSSQKRVRQNEARQARNRWRKRTFRTAIKTFNETILHGTVAECEAQLSKLYKILDQVASTPTIHKNTASRYKGRLAASLNKKKAQAPAAAAPSA